MAPSRRQSNGRSPLVNPQRQITAFFSKGSHSQSQSQSPSPSISKPNPNPNSIQSVSKLNPKPVPNPSSSPTTPSPLNARSKPKNTTTARPLLVIGDKPCLSSPTAVENSKGSYGEEVLKRRIRVYWPLDKCWYDGCVRSFNKLSGKHLVQYDDDDEELLDLSKEKIEWHDSSVKKFKRLRRVLVIDEEEDNVGDGDDSSDEDWEKEAEKEDVLEESLEDMEWEDEEDEPVESSKSKKGANIDMKKRKAVGVEKVNISKKSRKGRGGSESGKLMDVASNGKEEKPTVATGDGLKSDALERFGLREAEKFAFLGKDRRDANKRRPGDANYDPRTVYLPPQFLKGLSGGQRQWWEFKSKHMDKVLFFKMGKFYELFEMDAHIGVKELDLQYMKGEQPHCGFPERNFSMNLEKLARKGYRVLVVEQTETPEQLGMRRREEGSKDKVVKREICAVVTKGTLTEGEMLSANPDASYLMAITEGSIETLSDQKGERIYGVCVVDVATSRIITGQIKDNKDCSLLCCLLAELRPVEIIKPANLLSVETELVLSRCTRNPLVNDLVPGSEFWKADKTVHEITSFYYHINGQSFSSSPEWANAKFVEPCIGSGLHCLPDVLNQLVSAGEDGSFALSALGGALFYLKQAFLDQALLRYAKYEPLPCSGFKDAFQKPYMVLDAAALENLEIFENMRSGDSTGTLYAQLNHCVTPSGKRLLKAWLARPLYHAESIKERQDAIASLKGNNLPLVLDFRKDVSKLSDMERLLTQLFASSEANGRHASKIILYEDAAKKKLQEFISALRSCEIMFLACSSLGAILNNVNSTLLLHLLVPGKGLPDVSSVLKHFKDAFDWTEANDSGRIIPCKGVDKKYDSACHNIGEIVYSLKRHLKEQQKILNDSSITYVTVGKDAYLLEVPESLRGSVPREYELQSSKKGFFRYWTPHIKKLLEELAQAESEKESALKFILQKLIQSFCEHHMKWKQLVSTIAELDVLISLAFASDYYEGPTCCPIISNGSIPNKIPRLTATRLGHPTLRSDSLGEGTFVPNDVKIGGSANASFMLLTGPNMGGKSTLLRQVCLASVLAQIGADVPAEHFELSLVDRIFVRMGARDHIMAGQSTFLTELSETASMLACATCNSLVALDELGRGTSTSDGQAIAESVLEHFVRKVRCRGMFSTHYHRLAVNYKRDPMVSLCHMACQVGRGVGGVEEVTFLYRLTPGACPKSYGVNVARLAGIPDSVLHKAASKSREFEAGYGRRRVYANNSLQGQDKEETAIFLQDLIKNLEGTPTIPSLCQLQERARILIGQD